MVMHSVDLPAPVLPTIPTNSPRSMRSEQSCSTQSPLVGYRNDACSIEMIGPLNGSEAMGDCAFYAGISPCLTSSGRTARYSNGVRMRPMIQLGIATARKPASHQATSPCPSGILKRVNDCSVNGLPVRPIQVVTEKSVHDTS